MTLLATSDKPLSNAIKMEAEKNLSRKPVSLNVDSDTTIKLNTVLGEVTADGKFRPAVQTAGDGSEDFAGILVSLPDNNSAEYTFLAATDYEVVVLNQDALVAYEGLVVDASYNTTSEIDALKAQMEAVGIRVGENRPIGPLL